MKVEAAYHTIINNCLVFVKEEVSQEILDVASTFEEAEKMFRQAKGFKLGEVEDLVLYPKEEK